MATDQPMSLVAGSGSAPLPAELPVWYRKLGLNLCEGHAMSEDFACSHTSTKEKNLPGCVGVACPGVQVRISPAGEVLIKSPGLWSGPDATLPARCVRVRLGIAASDRPALRACGVLRVHRGSAAGHAGLLGPGRCGG